MTSYQRYSKTTYLVLCSLFAALLAVFSYITIPLPFSPVPLNLATLGVFLAGGLLGKKYGTLCIAVYLLMGIAGIPVFAGFRAGIGVLAGPTGGFLLGYPAAAFITGKSIECCRVQPSDQNMQMKHERLFVVCIIAMSFGTIICYILGSGWFMLLTGTDLSAALVACVLPFIPCDIIKILAGAYLVNKLHKLLI